MNQRKREDGYLYVSACTSLACKGAKSVSDKIYKFDVGMPVNSTYQFNYQRPGQWRLTAGSKFQKLYLMWLYFKPVRFYYHFLKTYAENYSCAKSKLFRFSHWG